MKNLTFLIVAPLLAITACSSGRTHSGFQTPSNTGDIAPSLTSARRGSDITLSGDGYAYAVGLGDVGLLGKSNQFAGYAGIVPTTTVSTPPTTGSATWNGTYEVGKIDGFTSSGDTISAVSHLYGNTISLTANFASGTLIGSNGFLSVNGNFTGSTLSGSVDYIGTGGALTGLVGATGAVGAFHGHDSNNVFAGGFIVGTP